MVTNLSSWSLYVSRLSKQNVSLRVCTFCFGTITQLRRGWLPPALSWLTGWPWLHWRLSQKHQWSLWASIVFCVATSPSVPQLTICQKCSSDARRFCISPNRRTLALCWSHTLYPVPGTGIVGKSGEGGSWNVWKCGRLLPPRTQQMNPTALRVLAHNHTATSATLLCALDQMMSKNSERIRK